MSAGPLQVDPLTRPPDADIALPGSKSITNRALVAAALSSGPSVLSGALVAEDTMAMVDCLAALGVVVGVDRGAHTMTVHGRGARLDGGASLWARQSGTTARFVLPLAAIAGRGCTVDGHAQIRRRPQRELLDALVQLGAHPAGADAHGELPVRFDTAGLTGGSATLPGHVSSQFVSALLLAGPIMEKGLRLELTGEVVSVPYIAMTVAVMASFGVQVAVTDGRVYEVPPGSYRAGDYRVEPDASAASYFFAAAAVSGGRVAVDGLGTGSIQGDVGFVDVLAAMGASVTRSADRTQVAGTGALGGVDVSLTDISDTAPTLGAIAPLASGPVRARGIGFIRTKESDRIAAVVAELRRLGADAEEEADGYVVRPSPVHGGVVQTYDDHRIAMAFSVLGLVVPGIAIAEPQCVAKTFPEFYDTLDALRAAGDADLAILAIDGPSGSGKSTVGRAAARQLGLQYLDTGAMYRSVTLAALERGLDPSDEVAVADLARHLDIVVGLDTVEVDGVDVTAAIRSEPVTAAVSQVAANPAVRATLRRQQRAWARRRGGGVLEGRDIGTVVFPSARLKVYVTASLEERARRRAAETGQAAEATAGDLRIRDRKDSSRADSPLVEAADAVVVDTTGLSVDHVVDRVVELFGG